VVDGLVDGVDQPEPIGLEPPQDRRLVGQIDRRVIAVQALGDSAVQVVDPQRGGIEEPPFVGVWVGWGLADEQDLEPVWPVLGSELLLPGGHAGRVLLGWPPARTRSLHDPGLVAA
jgi:hypothetical protein